MVTIPAAWELAPYQIRASGIAPGTTDTESNLPYM
jgi:NAD(P)-dependent dehydrogenase (short-subunit alcohol dehydrogenase family)